jgi:hypothetical protein
MRLRPALAIACCLGGAAAQIVQSRAVHGGDGTLFLGVAAVVAVAAGLIALRPLWAALAARGLLWTALAFCTLIGSIGHPAWAMTTTALAVCAALVALGRASLVAPSRFQPHHHRGPLTLALVLGFADAATLSWWAILCAAEGGPIKIAVAFAAFAAVIGASLVGLYRLYAWGFLLNLAANLALVGAMMLDLFHIDLMRLVFIVPAVAQILLALPVLIAIVRRRPLAVPAALARLARAVPAVAVAIMAALNVQVWFGEPLLRAIARVL